MTPGNWLGLATGGRLALADLRFKSSGYLMPKHRPPKEIWNKQRQDTWQRDKGRCQGPYCQGKPEWSLPLEQAHIDHIKSGKLANNSISNLRVLYRRCHVLRADSRHRGMIAAALKDGIVPPNWRELVW